VPAPVPPSNILCSWDAAYFGTTDIAAGAYAGWDFLPPVE